jgi:hypothetical protein
MSKYVADALPEQVARALQLEGERTDGQCFPLVTVDQDGAPRPCLLSVGELLVVDDRRIRAVVWPDSRTTANLDRGGTVLLTCAVPPEVFHLRATPRRLPPAPECSLARFELEITSVEVDEHKGMPVTQPMWFATEPELEDKVRQMWREQHAALRH